MGPDQTKLAQLADNITLSAIRERFGLSYWDSALLAAARACGCDTVYSEDMSSEQDYDGLRVVNPFTGLATSA